MKKATLGQGKQVLDLLLEHGSLEGADEILASGILADIFRSGLDREAWKKLRPQLVGLMDGAKGLVRYLIFNAIVVDYSMMFAEMVGAGKYDHVDSDIAEKNFRNTFRGKWEISMELVHFNRGMDSDDAVKKLDELGLRSAKTWELLAFGAQNPGEQRKYPIVALDSVWRSPYDESLVLCLNGGKANRRLLLSRPMGDFSSSYRFAAVRKNV